jgi:hypothetical protein
VRHTVRTALISFVLPALNIALVRLTHWGEKRPTSLVSRDSHLGVTHRAPRVGSNLCPKSVM